MPSPTQPHTMLCGYLLEVPKNSRGRRGKEREDQIRSTCRATVIFQRGFPGSVCIPYPPFQHSLYALHWYIRYLHTRYRVPPPCPLQYSQPLNLTPTPHSFPTSTREYPQPYNLYIGTVLYKDSVHRIYVIPYPRRPVCNSATYSTVTTDNTTLRLYPPNTHHPPFHVMVQYLLYREHK